MWHPDAVQQTLYQQMEDHAQHARVVDGRRRAAQRPRRAAAPPSVPEQLNQLAELRDRGVITAAEFEAKKAQLLDRM